MDTVGCAGILVADTVCGPMDSLPEEGLLLTIDSLPTTSGGCGANVAIGLAKQGIATDVAGRVGDDPSAQVILNELHRFGANTERITVSETQPTSQTIILLVRGQDRRFIHVVGANKEFAVRHIDRDLAAGLKVLYLGGLFVLPAIDMEELADLFAYCRSKGVITMLDVVISLQDKGMNGIEKVLPHVDYFTPNDDEAELLTGLSDPLAQARVFQDCGAGTVIITQGKHGALVLRGKDVWRANAFAVETVDPSGGGDAFSAGIITGIVRGWDMPQMLAYGGVLGASATLAPGTTTGVFTAAEAEAFLAGHTLTVTHETLG